MASRWVLCIFQLAAMIGRLAMRAGMSGHLQDRDAGERATLDELERRAAAGRQVPEPLLQAELPDRGQAVASAHHRERSRAGDRRRHPPGPGGERLSSNTPI